MDGFPATDQYDAIRSTGKGFASLFEYEDGGESLVRSLLLGYTKLKHQYRSIGEEDFLDIYLEVIGRGVAKQMVLGNIQHPPSYIYRAVNNSCQKFLSARDRHAKYVANGQTANGLESAHEYDPYQDVGLQEEVWKHFQNLDSICRAIIDLHMRGNTFARISEILGVSKSTANNRYLESIEILRNRVAGQPN